MFKNEEDLLNRLKADYDAIEVPQLLDDTIRKGIQKPPFKHKIYHNLRLAGICAAVLYSPAVPRSLRII
jgi:hypothetical protein